MLPPCICPNQLTLDSGASSGGGRPGARGGLGRWLPLGALAVAVGVYLVIFFVFRHRRTLVDVPRSDLLVSALGAEGAYHPVRDGDRLFPNQPVRFDGQSAKGAWVTVLGLRSDHHVSVYVPVGDWPPDIPAETLTALGHARLSAATGTERLLGVFCHSRLPIPTIQKAAERALEAAGGPSGVRSLDLGCSEASVLVQKAASAR